MADWTKIAPEKVFEGKDAAADALIAARDALSEENWTKGRYFKGGTGSVCACAHGAVQAFVNGSVANVLRRGRTAEAAATAAAARKAAAAPGAPVAVAAAAAPGATSIEEWYGAHIRNRYAHWAMGKVGLTFSFNDSSDTTLQMVKDKLTAAASWARKEWPKPNAGEVSGGAVAGSDSVNSEPGDRQMSPEGGKPMIVRNKKRLAKCYRAAANGALSELFMGVYGATKEEDRVSYGLVYAELSDADRAMFPYDMVGNICGAIDLLGENAIRKAYRKAAFKLCHGGKSYKQEREARRKASKRVSDKNDAVSFAAKYPRSLISEEQANGFTQLAAIVQKAGEDGHFDWQDYFQGYAEEEPDEHFCGAGACIAGYFPQTDIAKKNRVRASWRGEFKDSSSDTIIWRFNGFLLGDETCTMRGDYALSQVLGMTEEQVRCLTHSDRYAFWPSLDFASDNVRRNYSEAVSRINWMRDHLLNGGVL